MHDRKLDPHQAYESTLSFQLT